MVFITNKDLRDTVLPVLLSWLFMPQVEQLRKFLLQFKDLDATQMLAAIWRIAHPESLSLSDDEHKIQAVQRIVEESPQLSVLQTTMRRKEVCEHNTRYLEIKQEIWATFARDLGRPDSMRDEMFLLIQTSPPEIIAELSYQYHSIWERLAKRHRKKYDVVIPVALSVEERAILVAFLCQDDEDPRGALVLHEELVKQIVTHRQKVIDELLIDAEAQLALLLQQIE